MNTTNDINQDYDELEAEGLEHILVNELVFRALGTNADYAVPFALYVHLVALSQRQAGALMPRNEDLALQLRVNVRTITRALTALQLVGLVRVEYPRSRNGALRRLVVSHTPTGESRECLLALAAGQLTISELRKATDTRAGMSAETSTRLGVNVSTRSLDAASNKVANPLSKGVSTPCPPHVDPLSKGVSTPTGKGDIGGRGTSPAEHKQFALELHEQSGEGSPHKLPPSGVKAMPSGQHAAAPAPPPPDSVGPPPPSRARKRDHEAAWSRLSPERQAQVTEVLDAWATVRGGECRHTPKRRSIVNARLSEGFTPEQLIAVIKFLLAQPFYRGQNDRGVPYDDVEPLLRNYERVDRHLRAMASGRTGKAFVDRIQADLRASDKPLEEEHF